jgi:hypothetical protein
MELTELKADVQDALGHLTDLAIRTREVLLKPYGGRPPDHWLGPPVDIGQGPLFDELPSLIGQVAVMGLPTRYLANVRRTVEAFTWILPEYAAGRFSAGTVKWWRGEVERIYSSAADALDAAGCWLDGLAEQSSTGGEAERKTPNLKLLEEHELLSTEQLAEVLGVIPEVAGRRRAHGHFGECIEIGRRMFVRSVEVERALGLSKDWKDNTTHSA